ncbi:hypothetical protein [Oceanospirillum linum]|uniref:Uncharacterized protein n=1 Tax=Oceanospirillum linum TaxID=966 RepID=A0A1T1HAK8_OCELI|nr:hypothetical protein [Oceanospirillum linum]OOV86881.1 hypothetical protein BTA35_0211330 [Oceanospirillum linum]SEG20052.1 hypothetical protein SAMN04489856_10669 [Oleiphilus messinensis]SMP24350.1 hypothetical protein SAMN06264348_10568 [Oceanospirillum linum]
MEEDEIKNFIFSNNEVEVYYKYLVGQDVWYFQKNGGEFSKVYDEFKKFISVALGIPFNNISIVGSAKTRYSFSPNKRFKEFCDESDFDLVIVSYDLYKDIWGAYRDISQQSYLRGYASKCSNVFNGFVSIKDSDDTYGNAVLEGWQRKVRTFKADLQLKFKISHDINYRIYSDWVSVQDYHIRGISKLRDDISNEVN